MATRGLLARNVMCGSLMMTGSACAQHMVPLAQHTVPPKSRLGAPLENTTWLSIWYHYLHQTVFVLRFEYVSAIDA